MNHDSNSLERKGLSPCLYCKNGPVERLKIDLTSFDYRIAYGMIAKIEFKERQKMRFEKLAISICVMIIPAFVFAQGITRNDFIEAEAQMKSEYYKLLSERSESNLLLDQNDYDVKYWDLTVIVTDVDGPPISGKVIMTVESVIDGMTTIDYNFHSVMVVDSVRINGQAAAFTRPSGLVRITLDRAYNTGEQVTTVTYYHGSPPGSGFGSFTWNTHNGEPIISSLSEPEGAREWWPCKDTPHDKADSADVRIVIPSDLVGTSNGILVSNTDNGNGTRTFHWHISYPITTYLICVSISNYQSFTDWYYDLSGDSMPVTNYVYPEHYNQAVNDLGITPGIIAIYANLFGEYPFLREKYGHTIFPWGGGMEHQCNTSFGGSLITGNQTYDWIVAHELSHQWFGDMITCDTWPDIWMNEGFASYCEALWTEHEQGQAAYRSYMQSSNAVFDPSGPIYDYPGDLFDGNTIYNKGAWVLHILRGVMGDSAFFDGMYGYANHPDHQYGTIQTREFQHIMEQYYGDSLGWFFDEWVWGQNRPIYRYAWMKQDIGGGQYEIFLHITQTQSSPAPTVFTMPIKIYPRINSVDTVITVWDDARIDDFRFIVNGNPTTLSFDKYNWILREATSETYRMNIVTTELPDGYLGIAYDDTIEARGGIAPYAFSVLSGQLPRGLALESNSGRVHGTPDSLGTFNFTIRCADSSSPQLTDTLRYQMIITNVTAIGDDAVSQPTNFYLLGNYPNPFNPSTTIRLELPTAGQVRIDVYNIMGQHVQTVYDGIMNAGQNEVIWNSNGGASGVYLYRVASGDRSATGKMLLMK